MIIKPKVKDFMCLTAHPKGCHENVVSQINFVKNKNDLKDAPKKVLVIGASTGYGLASRITAAFGGGAATLGIMFERAARGKRTATPGWYQTAAFEEEAQSAGLYAKTINGDAYSDEVKDLTIETIRKDLGQVDMVVYSLAAPRRTMPDGTVYQSVLKTTGEPFTNKNLNLKSNAIESKTIPAASREEIDATIKVMGGSDWLEWIRRMDKAGVLSQGAVTVAYSYIGPQLTYPIYHQGTIGCAKQDLHQTADQITKEFKDHGIRGYISVNKGLVTQASAAIPIVPLYMSILYRVMKEKNLHEGCIEQMSRLFYEKNLFADPATDEHGWIRMDDWEMLPEVQQEVEKRWEKISDSNVETFADIKGYWDDFYRMFGFGFDNVDYEEDCNPEIPIHSIDS